VLEAYLCKCSVIFSATHHVRSNFQLKHDLVLLMARFVSGSMKNTAPCILGRTHKMFALHQRFI
jgi:hypothetical protein